MRMQASTRFWTASTERLKSRRSCALRSISTTRSMDHLFEIVRKDRAWNDDAARKQLVEFFDAWGPKDPLTLEGRQRLSSLLFA